MAGRFTEILQEHSGEFVSADLSSAVEANLENCKGKKPYMLVQADVRNLPVPRASFDVVICLGVIQHTPSSEDTIEKLSEFVSPGGLLVFDHYQKRKGIVHSISSWASMAVPVRALLKRMPPGSAIPVTTWISKIGYPIRRRTVRVRVLDQVARRLIPAAYAGIPGLSQEIHREWSELNTHDSLTDWHKHTRTPDEIRNHLEALGLGDIEVHAQSNGGFVEARARKFS